MGVIASLGHERYIGIYAPVTIVCGVGCVDEYQTLDVVEAGTVTIARLRGRRISDGEELRLLSKELTALADTEGRNSLLISLAAVEYMSSSAIGALIVARKKVHSRQGVVRLCGLQPDIHAMFSIAQMDRLFEIMPNEEDALAAFS